MKQQEPAMMPALRMDGRNRASIFAGAVTPQLTCASVLLVVGSLLAVNSIQARSPAQQAEAPMRKQTVALDSQIAEARRLSQQGKFDEAIGRLEGIAANQPDTKGLAHEFGIVYYKKGDYLKAAASFKK